MNFKKKLLLAGLLTATASSAAFAAFYPSHYIEKEFYSDAAKTKLVGSMVQTCYGRIYRHGEVTQYYSIEAKAPCEDVRGD